MKRNIRDIMNEMDKIEKVEITSDLLDDLQEYFKDEILLKSPSMVAS